MLNEKCNCGRPARYFVKGASGFGEGSCNKYARCPNWNQLKTALNKEQTEHGALKIEHKIALERLGKLQLEVDKLNEQLARREGE